MSVAAITGTPVPAACPLTSHVLNPKRELYAPSRTKPRTVVGRIVGSCADVGCLVCSFVLAALSGGGYALASSRSSPRASGNRQGWWSYPPLPQPASAGSRPVSRASSVPAPSPAPSPARVPPTCPHHPRDPRTALPLPADALGGASAAALRYYRAVHGGIAPVRGVIVEAATRQPPPARATARQMCGARVGARTVLVRVSLPEPPGTHSASLSFGLVLVSRFANGYAVWFQLH